MNRFNLGEKVFHFADLWIPVTYESSSIRFEILRRLLKFAFYHVLRKNIDLPCHEDADQSINDSVYYERLYDIQNGPRNYLSQLWFAISAIIGAFHMNIIYGRKHRDVADTSS